VYISASVLSLFFLSFLGFGSSGIGSLTLGCKIGTGNGGVHGWDSHTYILTPGILFVLTSIFLAAHTVVVLACCAIVINTAYLDLQ